MTTEQQPSDAELISAVRGGDTTAFGELFSRHVEAARRLARQLASAGDVEDLVSEAFAKVLTIVQRGGGPDLAFRAYLLTAVRSLHIDSVRGAIRLRPVDDLAPFDDGVPFRDTAVEGFENQAAARAFATLPERWQLVLWHTEVEGQKPAEVAQLLGISANSVSALAYRAREGLRQAFLNMHAQDAEDDACAWTQDNLGAYIRNAASKRDSVKVRAHVDECRRCMGIYLELTEVNTNLSGILGPLVLGSAAAGYIAAGLGAAAQGGMLGFLGRAGDIVGNHSSSMAMAGVAAAILLIAGLVVGLRGPHPEDAQPVAEVPVVTTPVPTTPVPRTFGSDAPTHSRAETSTPSTGAPGSATPDDPPTFSSSPSTRPSSASVPGTPGSPGGPKKSQDEPEREISAPPSPPKTTPPPNDVVVRAKSKRLEKSVWNVNVAMQGLAKGGGTMRVGTTNKELDLTLDDRCREVGDNAFECVIEPNPMMLNVHVVARRKLDDAVLTFALTPVQGVDDANKTNNNDQVLVSPRDPA